MSATRRPKDLPPIPPRRKKGEPLGRGRWKDPLIVHDDIRFGITNFRSVEPGDPDAANETPAVHRHGNSAASRRKPTT